MKNMKRSRRMNVMSANERFVRVWQAANSAGEAASELGLTLKQVYYKAAYLRRLGVAVKNFKERIDVNGLNRLVKAGAK